MSTAPKLEPDMILARIARALGVAGYSVEECDAIMAWLQKPQPPTGWHLQCPACQGRGRLQARDPGEVMSGAEQLDGMSEQTAMLVQGICLACRGRGTVS